MDMELTLTAMEGYTLALDFPVNRRSLDLMPRLDAIMVPEEDAFVNPLGIKGVGEIGVTGTVGAIANAVWHATGVRVRRFPIRIENLIGGL